MFGLVCFTDSTYGVYPVKNISKINESKCLVKHKGCKYEANLIIVNESREYLQKIIISKNNSLKNEENNISFSASQCDIGQNSSSFLGEFNESIFNGDLTQFKACGPSDEPTVEPPESRENLQQIISKNNSLKNEENNISFSASQCDIGQNSSFFLGEFNESIFNGDLTQFEASGPSDEPPDEPPEFQDDSFEDPDYSPDYTPESNDLLANTSIETEKFGNDNADPQDLGSNQEFNNDKSDFNVDLNVPGRSNSNYSRVDIHASKNDFSAYRNVINDNSSNEISVNEINDSNLIIEKSRGKKGDKKENFCFYCHKKQQKIARHFELKHKNEEEVKAFIHLPKGHPQRREIIGKIRKKGNFLYNTKKEYNDGKLIVSRRPKGGKTAKDFLPCANCKAFFSRATLATHFRLCRGVTVKNKRDVIVLSKRLHGKVHHKASQVLRKYIIPALRDDPIVQIIRYDELIIIFGNKMSEKYKHPRHYQMIRQRMRLISRFLLTLKEINEEISDFASIYDPKFIDDVMKAINKTAGFNVNKSVYEAPTVAFNLGTLLKQSANFLITECIKNHSNVKKKNAKDFLKIFTQELNLNVNRTVSESQLQFKRSKKVELPVMEDIIKLRIYLKIQREKALLECQKNFSFQSWLNLAETTLSSIQLFNRRRPGEIERILIEDFKNYQGLNKTSNKDLYMSLSDKEKQIAQKYIRFEIRGKLNRTVPVILDRDMFECVNLIVERRHSIGVEENNPYVFGIQGKYLHLKACNLMRKFSNDCGAENPERLRATRLRKHIATTCITLNLEEDKITQVADYMGHAEKIHKSIYRQPIVSRDVLGMSQLLEVAQGVECEDVSDEDEQEEDEEEERDVLEKSMGKIEEAAKLAQVGSANLSTRKVHKRKTVSFGSVQRRKWNEEEKNTISSVFSDYMKQKKLPSFSVIQQAVRDNPVLQNRTPPQIKTWMSNQYRKSERFGTKLMF